MFSWFRKKYKACHRHTTECTNLLIRFWGITQWIKNLTQKYEHWSLVPQILHKSREGLVYPKISNDTGKF